MVAELAENSVRKPHPRAGKVFPKVDLLTRNRARNLYALHQVSASEVAKRTGLTVKQVYSLAEREGWSKQRREIKGKSQDAQTARMAESIGEVVEAVGMESETLLLGTLNASHGVLADVGKDPDAPRNLQALSQSAKNFNAIFREARNLNARDDANATSQINVLFVGSINRTAKPEVNVTPQAPVSTTTDAQSTIC